MIKFLWISLCLSICLFGCCKVSIFWCAMLLFVCLSVYLSVCPSIFLYMSVCARFFAGGVVQRRECRPAQLPDGHFVLLVGHPRFITFFFNLSKFFFQLFFLGHQRYGYAVGCQRLCCSDVSGLGLCLSFCRSVCLSVFAPIRRMSFGIRDPVTIWQSSK